MTAVPPPAAAGTSHPAAGRARPHPSSPAPPEPGPAQPTSSSATTPTWLVAVALATAAIGTVLRWRAEPGLWLDEALGVNIAQVPLGDLVTALRHDGHPPLYPVLLKGWLALAGDGDTAARSLSMLLGTACLPVAWLAGRRLGGPTAAWLALTLVAASPYAIRYASEARMYALVQLLVLVGVLLVAARLRRPSVGVLVGVAGVTAALLLTHYWSGYLVVAAALALVGLAWRAPAATARAARRLLVAVAAGVVLFLPWLPVLADQVANTGTPWGRTRNPLAVLGMTLNGFGGNLDVDSGARVFHGQLLGAALAVVVLLAVLARPTEVARPTGGRPRRGLVLAWPPRTVPGLLAGVGAATLTLGALGCLVSGSAFASRYAAGVLILVLLAAAVGVATWPGPALVAALVALVPLGLVGGVRAATEPRTQTRELVAVINEQAEPGDVVVVCPDQLGPAVERPLRSYLAAVAHPDLSDPRFVDWRDYAERHRQADPTAVAASISAQAGPGGVWLVWADGYRWLDDQCSRLAAELGRLRPATVVAVADPAVLEHANLVRYGAP